MQRQPQINSKMRAILIDWLIQVHLKFNLLQETLYLTISIIDRYLQVCKLLTSNTSYLAISNLKSALVTHCCVVHRPMTCQRRSYSLLVWRPCWLPVNTRKCMLQKCRILSSSLTTPTQVQRFVAWRNRCWGWWTTVWALHSAYTSWEDTHVQEK